MAQLAAAMRQNWATGTASGAYEMSISGWTAQEMQRSAAGKLGFNWQAGVWRNVVLDGTEPLRVRRFTGTLALADQRFTLTKATLHSAATSYEVSGTATLARELDLRLLGDRSAVARIKPGTAPLRSFTITGTLERPRVAVNTEPETRASLLQ